MSKAARNKQQGARARIAAQQAAARRAEHRSRLLMAGGSVIAVLAVLAAFVVIRLHSGGPAGPAGPKTRTVLPAAVAKDITSVPASTLDAVAAGSVPSVAPVPLRTVSGRPLTSQGKPEVLYIGAEFCPYCAAMRWPLAVALSKFGTFSTPLRGIHSAPDEAPSIASLPTLTFYRSAYQSPYLTFTPVENEKIDHSPLQATTPLQQQVWDRYDPNSYPFIDIGNRYVVTIIYDARVLHGKTWGQVAAALHDPASPIARGAIGAANYLIAAICHLTGSKPTGVCSSPTISALH